MTHEAVGEPEARRALVLHDRSIVIDLIQLTLNHGGAGRPAAARD